MRLPEAHTTQTAAAGQCQAKLYIYIYVYEPYQGELTFVTALIFVPINPLAISLDYIATLLYRIYFYICTKQMILIVCLF